MNHMPPSNQIPNYEGRQALEKKKKTSFWKRMFNSVKDFESYQEWAIEPTAKTISYFIKLVALFTLILTITTAIKFYGAMETTMSEIDSKINDFTLKDGILTIEPSETIQLEKNEFIGTITIDTTSQDKNKILEEIQQKKENGIFITQDTIYVHNAMSGASVSYSLKEISAQLAMSEITKADMLTFWKSGNLYVVYGVVYLFVYVYLFLMYLISISVDLFILALLGFLTARIIGIRLKGSAACKMAVYSLTLPILLNLVYIVVHTFTGFTITYFQVMYTAISYIYMITAILLIKSDMIKRKVELTKIVEEQKRIQEEIEKVPEDPEKEQKKEEKKEKKKEKEEGESSLGEEPEGNQA